MSVSTDNIISIGLAHELINALCKRGVTKSQIVDIVARAGRGDDVAAFIRGVYVPSAETNMEALRHFTEVLTSPRDIHILAGSFRYNIIVASIKSLLTYSVEDLRRNPEIDDEFIERIQRDLVNNGYPQLRLK